MYIISNDVKRMREALVQIARIAESVLKSSASEEAQDDEERNDDVRAGVADNAL